MGNGSPLINWYVVHDTLREMSWADLATRPSLIRLMVSVDVKHHERRRWEMWVSYSIRFNWFWRTEQGHTNVYLHLWRTEHGMNRVPISVFVLCYVCRSGENVGREIIHSWPACSNGWAEMDEEKTKSKDRDYEGGARLEARFRVSKKQQQQKKKKK